MSLDRVFSIGSQFSIIIISPADTTQLIMSVQ